MKFEFKFNSNLEHQIKAIDSVIQSFDCISTKDNIFSIIKHHDLFNEGIGVGNQIATQNWLEILNKNIVDVQKRNGLEVIGINPKDQFPILDIEMETGTGKTYVFLRTILELNNKYGFKKFIILVPSIAIKKGVIKTLDVTKEHFKSLFNNVVYNYFEYNGKTLNEIFAFSNDNTIQIMITTIASINKKGNIFNKESESLSGEKPIDLVRRCNPIVIIDEPQKTHSGGKSIESVNLLNPLFTLRYSATFSKSNNKKLIYKLDPIEAYNKRLVKEIYVDSIKVENKKEQQMNLKKISNNKALIEISYDGKKISNYFSLNDNISSFLNNINENLQIVEFRNNSVLLSNGVELFLNEQDSKYDDEIKKAQIKSTIKRHLKKQWELKDKNIKVLSLFFLDKVSNYKTYENNTSEKNGKYAKYFEESFVQILNENPQYKELYKDCDIDELAKEIHQGYFSKDGKSEVIRDTQNGDSEKEEKVYDLIMKDKEKLLSFSTKLSFIFSHSALKEGWDNPNVFQICTLNQSNSEITKRQQIGRGLRLCVDANGNRIYDENINKLVVIANESFEEFSETLQKEFKEIGINFGSIGRDFFISIDSIDKKKSNELFDVLKYELNWIDEKDKVSLGFIDDVQDMQYAQSKLIKAMPSLNEKEVDLVINKLKDLSKSKDLIKDINNNKTLKVNNNVLKSEKFVNLWNKINKKTRYFVDFESEELIQKTILLVNKKLFEINNTYITNDFVKIDISQEEGVKAKIISTGDRKIINIKNKVVSYPDIVRNTANQVMLTRKTIIRVIKESNLFDYFKDQDPYNAETILIQSFKNVYEELSKKYTKYEVIEDDVYKIEKFIENVSESKEINLNDNVYEISEDEEIEKTLFNLIKCDSKIEKEFIKESLKSYYVDLIIKLPNWFIIDTPIGKYNPDWALYNSSKNELVVETKGSSEETQLREKELMKIEFAKKHFDAINKKFNSSIQFKVVSSFKELLTTTK